jgi:flagellar basal body-associated protein FliL
MSKKVITIIIIVAVVIAFVGIMATLQENGVIDDVTTEAPKQEEPKATEAPKLEKDPILDEIGFNDPQKVNNDKTGNWRIST